MKDARKFPCHMGEVMGQLLKATCLPLVDPFGVQIVYCTGLADARILNPHYMLFTGYVDVPDMQGQIERQCAFRIAMERSNVPAAIRLATAAIGRDMMNERLPAVLKFAA